MAQKKPAQKKPAQKKTARRRVLVVDDEAEVVDVLKEHFEETYDVDTASDGKRALKLIRTRRPEVILLDIHMPGLNGLEVLKRIQKVDGKPVVIVVTANEDTDVAAQAMSQGVFSYVPKPFDFQYLDHLVAVALG
jgi:two-component system response regulator (stage 0 sporulation protein F)